MTLPPGWSGIVDEECVTFEGESSLGALQVSSYRKDEAVTDEELRGLADEDIRAGAPLSEGRWGEFVGFELAYVVDEMFWRKWYLRREDQVLFVTYVCAEEDLEDEVEVVEQALATLAGVRGEASAD